MRRWRQRRRRLEAGNSFKGRRVSPKAQSHRSLGRRGGLTVEDEVTGSQQLQPLQQVEELADAPVPAAPAVHHPVGPLLLLLGLAKGRLVNQHHGG